MNSCVRKFAQAHRLKAILGADGAVTIPGKAGSIDAYSGNRLACYIDAASPRACNARVRNCENAGMSLTQHGDTEAVLTFDPENVEQAAVALRVARIKKRRTPSPAQLAVLEAARALQLRHRSSTYDE